MDTDSLVIVTPVFNGFCLTYKLKLTSLACIILLVHGQSSCLPSAVPAGRP